MTTGLLTEFRKIDDIASSCWKRKNDNSWVGCVYFNKRKTYDNNTTPHREEKSKNNTDDVNDHSFYKWLKELVVVAF